MSGRISQFACLERDLILNILDYSIETHPTIFTGSIAATNQDLQIPVLITMQSVHNTRIKTGDILHNIKTAKLCSGAVEEAVLPLVVRSGNYDEVLVGIVGEEVVYINLQMTILETMKVM